MPTVTSLIAGGERRRDDLGASGRIFIRYSFTSMGRRTVDATDRARAVRLVTALDAARDRAGWSVHELSLESGVHYETVRAVLAGRSAGPSFFIVADLARALHLPLDRLDRRTRR
jgi:hypothetical protein